MGPEEKMDKRQRGEGWNGGRPLTRSWRISWTRQLVPWLPLVLSTCKQKGWLRPTKKEVALEEAASGKMLAGRDEQVLISASNHIALMVCVLLDMQRLHVNEIGCIDTVYHHLATCYHGQRPLGLLGGLYLSRPPSG